MEKIGYAGYRFPPEIIGQAIWLYLRFTVSLRDVEDLLAESGVAVSYETVRRWVNHFGPMIAADRRKRRLKPPTPYVIADRVTGNLRTDTVSVDNEDAGAVGARHLIDLGHKDLLIAASSLSLANIRQRCSGATEGMRPLGLPEPAIVELAFSIDAASARLSKWFDENPPPTAIQALTNFTTLSALTTLAERGLRMPRDMSLIGFDDYTWMCARATPLTAIVQPVRDMGRALWDTLSARIASDLSPAKHVLLPCEIRVRASTGPVPDAHPATRPTHEAIPQPAGIAVR